MTQYPVQFVGAGPGDPELITVKGKHALETADLVVYAGSLVPDAVLAWTGKHARLENSAKMDLEAIVDIMAQAHFNGSRVVRLHSGDPSLYGAIAEQLRVLEQKGVACRIIPGVTAAFAAAAALKVEYTLPEVSQSLILTRMQGRTPVPEKENLASLAAHQTSMAVYLSAGLADNLQEVLAANYGPDAPVAVVFRASHKDEKVLWTKAGDLEETMKAAQISRQALVIAGPALEAQKTRDFSASKLYDKTFTHGYRKGHGSK
ncbi:MAG: precorrin-4 C(11)-methyltransferase [Desulfosalsimonas sp.]|uniref:precorrin-4 C(11)-methyltransferase n=1 Tax=Desulfosalsimonas sp. TaxID=3073848 RepID=UPI0039708721